MSDKTIKNSLLNAASAGFSIEDFADARLLVPVLPVQEEEKPIGENIEEATAEIDLQSDDTADVPYLVPQSNTFDITGAVKDAAKPLSVGLKEIDLNDSEDVTTSTTGMAPPSSWSAAKATSSVVSSFLPSIFRPAAVANDIYQVKATNPPSSETPLSTSEYTQPPMLMSTNSSQLPVGPPPLQPPFPSATSVPPVVASGSMNPKPPTTVSTAPLLPVSSDSAPEPMPMNTPLFMPVSSDSTILPSSDNPMLIPNILTPLLNPVSADNPPLVPPSISTVHSLSQPSSVSPVPLPTLPVGSIPSPLATIPDNSAPRTALPPSAPAPSGPPQGPSTSNKYRLGQQRLQYAQYPGLIPTATPSGQVASSVVSAPPPTVFNPSSTFVPAYQPGSEGSITSPSSQSYPADYNGTGYVFGEPAPTRNVVPPQPIQYSQVTYHWFYHKEVDGKSIWKPFSFLDSIALEDAFTANSAALVATDGGRYDVNVLQRLRTPVYWDEAATEVRRCSWFYKGPLDSRFIPYEEEFAQEIETEYEAASRSGIWNRRVQLGGGEAIILHSATVILHFCQAASPDEWGTRPESQLRPRVVKRGVDSSFMIEDGESSQIDHLVFLVHGIGAICDFKFRTIIEAVDDFRNLSSQMLHTHFSSSLEKGSIGRVEFLPVCWHQALHGDSGVDSKLKPITLPSIPKLRHFTNDTLLDILFYTSPVYCQRIVDTVGNEINRMYDLFLKRNLDFDGSASLAGHSLGSLILFDLMSHQPLNIARVEKDVTKDSGNGDTTDSNPQTVPETNSPTMVSYNLGAAGTGQPSIKYPAFDFHPTCVFALGSPAAVFVSIRGIETLGTNFQFPTCSSFFNIFHPYDPVAYRIEPLIDPTFDQPPVVIPHHKGRKRYHLEIKDAMFRMGTDIKQTMMETIKNTWKTVYSFASFGRSSETAQATLEQEIDRVIQGEMRAVETEIPEPQGPAAVTDDAFNGQLNSGRRIDYVLQEAPLESFNEYLFALSSHVCYWESEDTMLFILKEIYQNNGVYADKETTQSSSAAGSIAGDHQKGSASLELADPFHTQTINPSSIPPSPFYDPNTGQNSLHVDFSTTSSIDVPAPARASPSHVPVSYYQPSSLLADQELAKSLSQPQPIGPPPLTGFVRK